MPFNPKQMENLRNLAASPCDCLVCGGRACVSLTVRDFEKIEMSGRADLRCSKCDVKLTIAT